MRYWVYILRCGDGTLYTGSTNDVTRRLAAHRSGRGAKYTRSRPPVSLVYREALADKSAALRREAAIKRLSRAEKLRLIQERGQDRMRRQDRDTGEEFAWQTVDGCDYAVLSMLSGAGAPYAVPLNMARDGQTLYFHCAAEGQKLDNLRQNPAVCVTWVKSAQVVQEKVSTEYASAVAFGRAAEVTEPAAKAEALRLLARRLTPDVMEAVENCIEKNLERTGVWKITVERITGKANR